MRRDAGCGGIQDAAGCRGSGSDTHCRHSGTRSRGMRLADSSGLEEVRITRGERKDEADVPQEMLLMYPKR